MSENFGVTQMSTVATPCARRGPENRIPRFVAGVAPRRGRLQLPRSRLEHGLDQNANHAPAVVALSKGA
jgi:hypothetical protein